LYWLGESVLKQGTERCGCKATKKTTTLHSYLLIPT
jgi:hypothetical protein